MKDEHEQFLTDAQHVSALVGSSGWQLVYPKLTERILDIQNISNLADITDPQQLLIEIKARKLAADTLFTWLKQDVFGLLEQQQATNLDQKEVRTYISGE